MHSVLDFVTKHGYSVLFGGIFVHQLGLPVPGPLFLIAAGCARSRREDGTRRRAPSRCHCLCSSRLAVVRGGTAPGRQGFTFHTPSYARP